MGTPHGGAARRAQDLAAALEVRPAGVGGVQIQQLRNAEKVRLAGRGSDFSRSIARWVIFIVLLEELSIGTRAPLR
jgi:hypothetical protein